MSNLKSFYGSICYTDLLAILKQGKADARKVPTAAGDKIFVNINVWVNETPDKYGNNASMQVKLKEEFKDEKKPYIGNLKYMQSQEQPVNPTDLSPDDDLPF